MKDKNEFGQDFFLLPTVKFEKNINEKKIAYVWIFKQFKCYVLGASLEFKGKCGTLLMNTCNNN